MKRQVTWGENTQEAGIWQRTCIQNTYQTLTTNKTFQFFLKNGQRFRYLTKKDLWMACKVMRRCSTSLAIRECKWTQMRCTSILLEGLKPRLTHQCWENVEQTGPHCPGRFLYLWFFNPAPFIFPRETEHTPTGTLSSWWWWHFY